MVVALIDADVLCYAAAYGGTHDIDWDGDGEVTHYDNEERAVEAADSMVRTWVKAAKADDHKLIFSDRTHPQATFRYGVHPHYKGQRSPDKPILHDYIHDYLFSKANVVWKNGLEGDDVIGLMCTGPNADKYVGVSVDKDMLTVPGHICLIAKETKIVHVSQFQADYNWMMQTLTGDLIDNYKGAPGVGPKTAQKLLAGKKNIVDMWPAVIDGYNSAFGNEKRYPDFVCDTAWDEALMNARCSRILRYGDYDPKGQRVRLWHPDPDEYEWRNLV
jgi:DNA polymerase-1